MQKYYPVTAKGIQLVVNYPVVINYQELVFKRELGGIEITVN